ncbi:MAG: hypothetical protein R3F46_13850 [bacterium]
MTRRKRRAFFRATGRNLLSPQRQTAERLREPENQRIFRATAGDELAGQRQTAERLREAENPCNFNPTRTRECVAAGSDWRSFS